MLRFPRAIFATLLAVILLAFWTTRRAPAPQPRRETSATSLATPAPASSAAFPILAPQGEAEPSSAPVPAGARIELVRRCLHLAETDPLAAMDLAVAQKLTADDPGLLNALILRWADQDFSGALEWARAQPHDAGRDDILAHLAYMRSQSQPAAAAEIAATEIFGPRTRAEAILSVVHQWAGQNPSAAQAWSVRLSDADLRKRALEDIAATRAQRQVALASGGALP